MYPLHDNDLDRLSRNAAEHYEVDFGSSGWEQLQKRLDQELPPPRNRRRFLFWLFFIVVTTGSALIGLLIGSQPARPYAANNIRAMAPVNRLQADAHPAPMANGTANKYGDTHVEYRADVDDAVNNAVDRADAVNEKANQQVTENVDVENVVIADNTVPNKSLSVAKKNSTKPKRPVSAKKSARNNTPHRNLLSNKTPIVTELSTDDQSYKQINELGNTTPVGNNKIDSTANTSAVIDTSNQLKPDSTIAEKADKPKIPHNYKKAWEFAIMAGPDGSMVEFGPLFKAGYNFGVQIGYRFNDRWSANTGLIYTRKYYQADSNTFHAPAHSPISYVKIDALKGFCSMFDIPLNIRYDIAFNDKRRLFASAGASTYLMKRQYYDCYYRNPNNPVPQQKEWDSETSPYDRFKKNYLFSVLNLSAGYERTVNRHFSIQAEPYIKIPLTGMGYGTMKIGSYGMFFSLKYHPSFKSVPKK